MWEAAFNTLLGSINNDRCTQLNLTLGGEDFSSGPKNPEPVSTWKGHAGCVMALAVLPDGSVVSGSDDNTLRRWDAQTGRCLGTWEGHTGRVTALTVLPDGSVVSGSFDKSLRRWDAQTGRCLGTWKGHTDWVNALTVLPDGSVVSGSTDTTLRRWDAQTGRCLGTWESHRSWFPMVLMALTVLPDGSVVSGSSSTTLRRWDAQTGRCLGTWEGHKYGVTALTVLPDGSVVSGSWDKTLRRWDAQTGRCLGTWEGHTGRVTALTVLPDGSVVSGSWDKTLRRWDAQTGRCLGTWLGTWKEHTGRVTALTVLPDGSVVSGGHGVRRWPKKVELTLTRGQLHKVFKALQTNTSIKVLKICNVKLTQDLCKTFSDVIKWHPQLTALTVKNCGLNDDLAKLLLQGLQVSQSRVKKFIAEDKNLSKDMNKNLQEALIKKSMPLSETRVLKATSELDRNSMTNLATFREIKKQFLKSYPDNPFYPTLDYSRGTLVWVSDKVVNGNQVNQVVEGYGLLFKRSLLINTGEHGSDSGKTPETPSLGEGKFIVEDFISAIEASSQVAVHIVSPGVPPRYPMGIDVINAWCYSSVDKLENFCDDTSKFSSLANSITKDWKLQSIIHDCQQVKDKKLKNVIPFAGSSQVGKSSTLNFISRCKPYIERGAVKETIFKCSGDGYLDRVKINKKTSKQIFEYLLRKSLIGLEDLEDGMEEDERNIVPQFNVGESLSSTEELHPDKVKLKKFISEIICDTENIIDVEATTSFVMRKLSNALTKKVFSDEGQPSIGFLEPVFEYGAGGLSTTKSVQVKRQLSWNATTLDMPGSGDSRGDATSLISAYSTYCALKNTVSVKSVAIVLSYSQLTGGATNADVPRVLQSLITTFGNELIGSNMCLLITKVPLTKKLPRGRGVILKSREEVRGDVHNALNRFKALLSDSDNADRKKLASLIGHIIDKNRFLPVTPLKTMDCEYNEKFVEENVNNENLKEIIEKFDSFPVKDVSKRQFSRIYSADNIAIADILRPLEDELVSLSHIAKKSIKEVKKNCQELNRKFEIISFMIKTIKQYKSDINKAIKTEKEIFREELKQFTEDSDFQKIDISKFTDSYTNKITVEMVKKHTFFEVKRRMSSQETILNNNKDYLNNELHLEGLIRNYKIEIEKVETTIAGIKANIEKNGENYECVSEKKDIIVSEKWLDSAKKTFTLHSPVAYPSLRLNKSIRENNAKFKVTEELSDDKERIIDASLFPRSRKLVRKYQFKGTFYAEALLKHTEGWRLTENRGKLAALVNAKMDLEKKLKDLRAYNEAKEIKFGRNQKIKKEYLEKLSALMEKTNLSVDDYSLVTISDIRKIMVSSIMQDAENNLIEISKMQGKMRDLLVNKEYQENVRRLECAIDSFRYIDSLIEISLALDAKSRFKENDDIKSLCGLEKSLRLLNGYINDLKLSFNKSLNIKKDINQLKKKLSQLSFNMCQYDNEIQCAINKYYESENNQSEVSVAASRCTIS